MTQHPHRFEVRATCAQQGAAKFGQEDLMWCGRTRAQAEKALKRMEADVGYCWKNWRIHDYKAGA